MLFFIKSEFRVHYRLISFMKYRYQVPTYLQYSISILGILQQSREDVRGVAGVVLATPFFLHMCIYKTVSLVIQMSVLQASGHQYSGLLDFWTSGLLDFWPSRLLVFQTSVLLVFGLLTIWTSSLLDFWPSSLPDFWSSGIPDF